MQIMIPLISEKSCHLWEHPSRLLIKLLNSKFESTQLFYVIRFAATFNENFTLTLSARVSNPICLIILLLNGNGQDSGTPSGFRIDLAKSFGT